MSQVITIVLDPDNVAPSTLQTTRAWLDTLDPNDPLTRAIAKLTHRTQHPTLDDPPTLTEDDLARLAPHDRAQLEDIHQRTHTYCITCTTCHHCHHPDHENYCPQQ